MKIRKKLAKLDRRDFLKIGGLFSAGLGFLGVAGAGLAAGKNTDSYTGWERYTHGDGQFFNRKPFEVDQAPTIEKVSETRRINSAEQLFYRIGMAMPFIKEKKAMSDMPERLAQFYKEHPNDMEEMKKAFEAGAQQRKNWSIYKDRYAIADAWSNAHASSMGHFPERPKSAPEESDFSGVNSDRLRFKSPKHASALMKKISHSFGATLVGCCRLNPDFVYQGRLRGVGTTDFEVPEHWKNCIVIATPHEWDALYANPTYGTSYDAYSRECIIAGKIEVFLKEMGYSARAHIPGNSYDLAAVPIAIEAGLGELGRNSILITPELGSNARLAVITTDLDLLPDKPIDFGVKKFCEKCKICAEQCPSGSICFDEKAQTIIRGYKRWHTEDTKCFGVWNTVAASHARGCRICIAVCPYSRKNNWIHTIAREVDPRDPTGLFSSGLLTMQKGLFEYPDRAEDYLPPPDGNNSTYHDAPDWLKTEEWCDVNVDW